MRAHIDVTDFVDLRSGGFHLDRDAGNWIRAWPPHSAAARPTLAQFSYQRR